MMARVVAEPVRARDTGVLSGRISIPDGRELHARRGFPFEGFLKEDELPRWRGSVPRFHKLGYDSAATTPVRHER
jgi:hypothetical protein